MERDDLLMILRQLGEGLVGGEIAPDLFARTVDGLISSNLDTVPDLESVHLRLLDYGMRGAESPVTPHELEAIARRLIDAAKAEQSL